MLRKDVRGQRALPVENFGVGWGWREGAGEPDHQLLPSCVLGHVRPVRPNDRHMRVPLCFLS